MSRFDNLGLTEVQEAAVLRMGISLVALMRYQQDDLWRAVEGRSWTRAHNLLKEMERTHQDAIVIDNLIAWEAP